MSRKHGSDPSDPPKATDLDPNLFPKSAKDVLRIVTEQGGWDTSWSDAPASVGRRWLEQHVGIDFQREHPLHAVDKRLCRSLAARLRPEPTS